MVFLKGVVYPLGGIAAGVLLSVPALLGWDLINATGFLVIGLAGLWLVLAHQVRLQYMRQIGKNLSIELHPARTPRPKPPAALLKDLHSWVREIRGLQHRLRETEDPEAEAAIVQALAEFFEMLGDLIGDRRAVDAAAQRYLYGDDSERASAVELIDTLLDTRRIPGATDLLDSLSRDHARGLLVTT